MVQNLSLLDLPAEIRIIALKLLLARPYTLRMNTHQDIYFTGGDAHLERTFDGKIYGLAPQLLCSCRRVLNEGFPILYSNLFDVDVINYTASATHYSAPSPNSCERHTLGLSQNQIDLIAKLKLICGIEDRPAIHQTLAMFLLHCSWPQSLVRISTISFAGSSALSHVDMNSTMPWTTLPREISPPFSNS